MQSFYILNRGTQKVSFVCRVCPISSQTAQCIWPVTCRYSLPECETSHHLENVPRLRLSFSFCLTSFTSTFTHDCSPTPPNLLLFFFSSLTECWGICPPERCIVGNLGGPQGAEVGIPACSRKPRGWNQRTSVFYSTDFQFYWFSVQWTGHTHTQPHTHYSLAHIHLVWITL